MQRPAHLTAQSLEMEACCRPGLGTRGQGDSGLHLEPGPVYGASFQCLTSGKEHSSLLQ